MRETEGAAPASQAVGYDIAAVEAWIAWHIPALRPPLLWTRLEGGHSNLSYWLQEAVERLERRA